MGADSRFRSRKVALARILTALACLLFAPLCVSPAGESLAAAYPTKEIALTLPETEGGQSAMLYGLIQRFARQHASFPLTLDYRPGRGGSYAWSSLKDKPGTGYALAAVTFPSSVLLAADKDRAFTPDDMAALALFAYAPNALWVAEDSPIRTLDDLAAAARNKPYSLYIAGIGSYTEQHMAELLFNRAAGVQTLYMPLAGGVECAKAVKEKRATACWGYALVPASMPGLRPLAVAAPERSSALPDTPTFRERKMEVVSGQYFGLAMPASGRADIREAVAAFFLEIFSDAELLKEVQVSGFTPHPLPLQAMPAFAGKQRQEVEHFLNNYSMYPKGGWR